MSYTTAQYTEADISPIIIDFVGRLAAFFVPMATVIGLILLYKWIFPKPAAY